MGLLDRDQNRLDDASAHYEEALKDYRALAAKNPDTYLPDLAGVLNSLGIFDRHQNRLDEARTHYEEALTTRRQLAAKNTDTYLPDVAVFVPVISTYDP